MIQISCTIVLYNNPFEEVKRAVDSFLRSTKKVMLYLVDNSPEDKLRFLFNSPRIKYLFCGRNLGFGPAHNIAIQKIIGRSKYHLILNPDVEFDPEAIERLYNFMEQRSDIGLVMPKVLYENGEIQYLCKKLPTPTDLILRRFMPGIVKSLFKSWMEKYELKDKDYNSIMDIPNLSGCFMFVRTAVLEEIGYFDEQFFLYMEDTDLCRRINERYRTVYYPTVSIIHGYRKASYKSLTLMRQHLKSSIKYFNKWGWFTDKERWLTNKLVEADMLYMKPFQVKRSPVQPAAPLRPLSPIAKKESFALTNED
jgi:GT2 family glycosyltransferase